MKKLLNEVLSRIKPNEEERRKEIELGKKVMEKLKKIIPSDIRLELVGSVAKDTNLKNDRDIDIFILFTKKYPKESLERLGLRFAKEAIKPNKWEVGYAEHPYLKTEIDGCEIEIVPSFKITSIHEKASSVDRSPLHTKYVLSKLSEEQHDEVRLLKQFLKRFNIYGAELRVEGFSGYLCELLIIHHGSFEKLLKSAAIWKNPIIDIEGHYRDEKKIREKFKTPLIVLDPVDMNRNVAAATSQQSLSKFILAARAFLKKPSREFFFGKKPKVSREELIREMRRRGTKFACLVFPKPKVVEDILWPQLKKAAKNIAKHFEFNEFKLFDCGVWSDGKNKCIMLFEFEVYELPKIKKIVGPAIFYEDGVKQFIKKHKHYGGIWVENGELVTIKERKFPNFISLIQEITKNPKNYAIPSHISKSIKNHKLLLDEKIVQEEFYDFLHSYLKKKEEFLNSLV
jgi:tRNA nucleotidyltransferase (CCA-adding enzyme)